MKQQETRLKQTLSEHTTAASNRLSFQQTELARSQSNISQRLEKVEGTLSGRACFNVQ